MSQEIEKPRPKRGSFSSWRGNKYPEVKLRGFYSDITSHENLEKTKVMIILLRFNHFFNLSNSIIIIGN